MSNNVYGFTSLTGGVTGETYTITCKIITTTNAEKYELDSDLPVAEI